VLDHRIAVALTWLLVALAGGVMAPTTVDRLSYEFALPGQPAYEANAQIVADYGNGGSNNPLLLVTRGDDAAAAAVRVAAQAQRAVPGTRVVVPGDPGADDLVGAEGRLAVVVAYPPVVPGPDPYVRALPALEQVAEQFSSDQLAAGDGSTVEVQVTGFDALAEGSGGDRGVLIEVLFGGLGALVVLLLVFGSLLAGLPLVIAAVSILGTYLCLLGLTAVTDVSFVVQYLVALIGLGVAIDYSLLIVTRWREERSHGTDNDEAVRAAMATAGRSVLFSGITVAVSLAALMLVPVPFLRSIGLGGLLIPLLSVATSLTLLPAILSSVGPRLQWPRRTASDPRSRFWARVARGVLAHRWVTILGTSTFLILLALPVLRLTLGSPELTGLASSSPESQAATAVVDAGVPVGVLRPTEVLVADDHADRVVDALRADQGVAAAIAPPGAGWSSDGTRLVQVWTRPDPAGPEGRKVVDRIRDQMVDFPGTAVGGSPAEDADFVSAVYDNVIWVALAVALITFLLLARALRSLWLPVKALVLNVVSIAAAYGVTVLVWQDGHGSELLFGQQATGAVTTWVPIAAFAFLFGLSMDYEVFILSRMREAYDVLHDTDRAVIEGIAYTGRLVTSAAIILFLAFVALSTVPSIDVKIFATTLAIGILLDAVVVRGLLAPALVAVLGRWNWVLPRWLARLVRVPD
jgi:RND superfamily putative drug exporter